MDRLSVLRFNTTNDSFGVGGGSISMNNPLLLPYYVFCLAFHILILMLIVTVMCSLCCQRKVHVIVAVFLVNQLVACVFETFAVFAIIFTIAIRIIINHYISPSDGEQWSISNSSLTYCRILMWTYSVGTISRLWSLMAFSIVILIIVIHGPKVFKRLYLALGIAGVWFVAFCLVLYAALPYPLYAVTYIDNVGCFPNTAVIPASVSNSTLALFIIFGGLLPLAVSISIPAIALCYLKKHAMTTSDAPYKKSIARFALFLVAGGAVNILGQVVPVLVELESEAVGLLVIVILVPLSLLPTPILIMVFLKPVRDRAKGALCYLCLKYCPRKSPEASDVSTPKHVTQSLSTIRRSLV